MSKASNPRLDDARKILFEAVSADSRQETQIAIKKYIEGVDILMCIYNGL
jgi:hypothetical protein